MRLHPSAGWVPAWIVALGGLLAAAPTAAVTLTCGNANGLAGQTVTVSVSSTDLTVQNVTAYEFRVAYNPSIVTAVGVSTAGTLTGTAGWATPTYSVTSGQIALAAAGTTALTGSGTLIKVSFTINPAQLTSTSTPLTLSGALLNEGTPKDTTVNGTLTVNATPIITVSPNTGEIARGATLQFTVSGSVTDPVTWSSTDPTVATIGATGLLTGVTPGSVRVSALDAAGHSDVSNGDILVRGMAVTLGTVGAHLGDAVQVPVTTTSLTGLGIIAGELEVSFDNRDLAFVSATAPAGTLLAGSGTVSAGTSVNGSTTTLTIVMGGSGLTGAGTLFDLGFTVLSPYRGNALLTLVSALFNENLPAVRTNGQVTIAAPSTFNVQPASVTLLVGQQQQFTLSGASVAPVTWSTLDPTVATIDATGKLAALAGGSTQVEAVDAVGGTAFNTLVDVFDFRLSVITVSAAPGQTFRMPLQSDRDLGPLHVGAVEMALGWPTTWITAATPASSGAIDAWGAPLVVSGTGTARIVAAGGHDLPSPTYLVSSVDFTLSPATPVPTDIPVTLSAALFNEGRPRPLLTNGTIRVRAGAAVPDGGALAFALAPAIPNPAPGSATLAFTLPGAAADGAPVRLALYALDGRRVRTLCEERLAAGRYERTWDVRADDGRPVSAGVYLARLEWGGRTLQRKLVVLR